MNKIEISGAGLNDYSVLSFHYKDNSIKSVNLYLNKKTYYTEQYLSKHHKFNYDDMFEFSKQQIKNHMAKGYMWEE